MKFRKKMSVRHSYSNADGWKEVYVCKIQMKVWLFLGQCENDGR